MTLIHCGEHPTTHGLLSIWEYGASAFSFFIACCVSSCPQDLTTFIPYCRYGSTAIL